VYLSPYVCLVWIRGAPLGIVRWRCRVCSFFVFTRRFQETGLVVRHVFLRRSFGTFGLFPTNIPFASVSPPSFAGRRRGAPRYQLFRSKRLPRNGFFFVIFAWFRRIDVFAVRFLLFRWPLCQARVRPPFQPLVIRHPFWSFAPCCY